MDTLEQDINADDVVDYIDDLSDEAVPAFENHDNNGHATDENGYIELKNTSDDGPLIVHAETDDLDYDLMDSQENNSGNDKTSSGKAHASRSSKASGNNIWISNISTNTKAVDLKQLFSKYGKVVAAKIVVNAKGGATGKRFGLIQVNSPEDADRCVKNLHKTEFHGKFIMVDKAQNEPQTKKISADTKTLSAAKETDLPKSSRASHAQLKPSSPGSSRRTAATDSSKGKPGVIRTRRSSADASVSKNRVVQPPRNSPGSPSRRVRGPDLRTSLDDKRKSHRSRSPVVRRSVGDHRRSNRDVIPAGRSVQRPSRLSAGNSREVPSLFKLDRDRPTHGRLSSRDRDRRGTDTRRRSISPRRHRVDADFGINYFGSDKARRSLERSRGDLGGSLLGNIGSHRYSQEETRQVATGKDDLRHFLSARGRDAEKAADIEKRRLEKEKQALDEWKRKEMQKAKEEFQNMQDMIRREKEELLREKERMKKDQEKALAEEKRRLQQEKAELRRAKERLDKEKREAEEKMRKQKEAEAKEKERQRREERRKKEDEERSRRRKPSPYRKRSPSFPRESKRSSYRERSRERDRDRHSDRDRDYTTSSSRADVSRTSRQAQSPPRYENRYPMDAGRRDYQHPTSYEPVPPVNNMIPAWAQMSQQFPNLPFNLGARASPASQQPSQQSRAAPMFLGGGHSSSGAAPTASYPGMGRPDTRGYQPTQQTRRF